MHDTIPHEHAREHALPDHGIHERAFDNDQGTAHSHDHDHDHAEGTPHTHAGGTPHTHAPEQVPDNTENLILDIGADTGALIIHAAIDRDQAEVEISPAGREQARTHNIVRRREAVSGAVYAAVFPALTAGDYTVWRDATTPAGTIAVQGGHVASFRLN
jgi:hypothetical protein